MTCPIKRDTIAVADLTGADGRKTKAAQRRPALREKSGEKADVKFFGWSRKLIGGLMSLCRQQGLETAWLVRADK